jgi:ParB-like chromosome segregation protein Spo0J
MIERQTFHAEHPLADLVPHPDNPRRGDVLSLAEAIEALGFYGAVYLHGDSSVVLAGWHRVLALHATGITAAPVIRLYCDDATALRVMLADNRIGDLGHEDPLLLGDALAALAASPLGLAGTGYTTDDLADLMAAAEAAGSPWGSSVAQGGESRSLVLLYDAAGLREVVTHIDALCSRWGLDSAAAVVRRLVLS